MEVGQFEEMADGQRKLKLSLGSKNAGLPLKPSDAREDWPGMEVVIMGY